MATKISKSSTVKAKGAAADKTSAPKRVRARKPAALDAEALATTEVATVEVIAADVVATLPAPADVPAIALRAYERFCARGWQHGCDVEDWLAAERELTAS